MSSSKKVNIQVSSSLKGISCTGVPHDDISTSITWATFFHRKYGFKVNQEKHWVKSGSGKHVGCMNETIQSFLDQYEKRKPATVHVYVVRTNKKTKEILHARRKNVKRERIIEEAARAEAVPGSSRRVAQVHKKNVTVRNGHINHARPSVHLGSLAEPSINFPEDNIPNVDPIEGQNGNDIGDDGVMFDDDASQCSQDSQDPGDDMKGEVIQKLRRGACNGDFHRVRDELIKLKRQNKKMKVARYIPYAMNLLSLMFDD